MIASHQTKAPRKQLNRADALLFKNQANSRKACAEGPTITNGNEINNPPVWIISVSYTWM